MLSNTQLKKAIDEKKIIIKNCVEECFKPSSYLLRISDVILEENDNNCLVDTKSSDTSSFFIEKKISKDGFILEPKKFYLLSSVEQISLTEDYAALLSQLSSMARIGISVNFSSNLVAATFGVNSPSSLTFEVINQSNRPIIIYPFVKFCHISFFKHDIPTDIKYNGIYSGSNRPVPSNFKVRPSK